MRSIHRWLGFTLLLALVSALGGCSCGKRTTTRELDGCDPRFVSADGGCGAGAVEGAVRYEGRSSHAGIRVGLGEPVREAVTGEDGRFSFANVRPGTYPLRLLLPAGDPVHSQLTVSAGKVTLVDAITIPGATRVEGRIFLEGAEPGGTLVMVVGGPEVAVTRADGSFVFAGLAAGARTLRAVHPGYVQAERTITVTGDELVVEDWTLAAMPRGTIAGRVTLAETDEGAPFATVVAVGGRSAVAAADGTFEIRGLAAGTWEVRAGFPGRRPAISEGVEVTPGRVTEISLRLEPSGLVTSLGGRALRLGEQDHAGIEVMLDDGAISRQATTRPDGSWEMTNVPLGLYELRATVEGLEPALAAGVAVNVGPNVAPELILSPAVRVLDREPYWGELLPRTRRALFQFGDGWSEEASLSLYDRSARTLRPLVDGSYWTLATDPAERFVTVSPAYAEWRLERLSIDDGTLDPVVVPSSVHDIWTWKTFSLVSDESGQLFVLKPDRVEADPAGLDCRVSFVTDEMWEADPDDRVGTLVARTQCGGRFFALADFAAGFVGPFGDGFYPSDVPTRGVVVRRGNNFRAIEPSRAWWVDADAHVVVPLSDAIFGEFGDPEAGTFAFSEELGAFERPLKVVDLNTGATTRVSDDAYRYYRAGPNLVVEEAGDGMDPLRWFAIDTPGSGTLCSDVLGVEWDADLGTIACFGTDRRLNVLDPRTRTPAQWGTDVERIDFVDAGSVVWTTTDGAVHLRHIDGSEFSVARGPNAAILPMNEPNRWLLMDDVSGTRLVDSARGVSAQLMPPGEFPFDCEVSPSMSTAVCVESCAMSTCVVIHDLTDDGVLELGHAPRSAFDFVKWAADESSLVLGAGDAYFAGLTDGAWEGTYCDLEADWWRVHLAPGGIASAWELYDGTTTLCHLDGTMSFAGWNDWYFEPAFLPGSTSLVLWTGVADLSTGAYSEFETALWQLFELPGGLAGADDWSRLVQFGPDGGTVMPDWFDGVYELGGVRYAFTWGNGSSTAWKLQDGSLVPVVRGIYDWIGLGSRELIMGRYDALGAASLSIFTPTTGEVVEVDQTMDVNESWWRFDGGLAFASARDFGVWVVSETGALRRIAENGELVHGTDVADLFVGTDDLLWHVTPGETRAVLQGTGFGVADDASGMFLISREFPGGTYWYEVSR